MRGVILVLILLVVVAIAAVATGFINITQTRPASVPAVAVGDKGVVVKGGQEPAFKIETGKVQVKPPQIEVTPRGEPAPAAQQPAARQQAPAPAPSSPAAPTTDSTQP